MPLTALLILLLAASPALAHGTVPVTPDTLWQSWHFDAETLVPLLLGHWLYGRGVLRLWARAGRGRGIAWWRVGCFVAGEVLLVAALVSPLDKLGGTLLSAHMTQHALLMAVAPPLLLLGRPGAAIAWALPAAWPKSAAWRGAASAAAALARPLPAALLHGAAMWLWHAPTLFEAAVLDEALHTAEHIAFFGSGLLFWSAVLSGAPKMIGPAFATLLHGGMLGGLLTMAPTALYRWYVGRAELWGMTALEDQQLAGLLMWVPMGLAYFAGCLFLVARLLGREARAA